jgi:cysteine-rich repeat protein
MSARARLATGALACAALLGAVACESTKGGSTSAPAQTAAAAPQASATAGPAAVISGTVVDYHDRPLGGALVTAYDDERGMNVSVFTDGAGHYEFPPLETRTWRLRVRILGHERMERTFTLGPEGANHRFTLRLSDDAYANLPATYYFSRVQWPDQKLKANFALACANCHQIGDPLWRKPRTQEEWEAVIKRMEFRGPPLVEQARKLLIPTLAKAFDPHAKLDFELPGPPTGDSVRAVLWEYEVDPEGRNGCHDLELGLDGWVYTEDGFAVNPATMERRRYPITRGSHSIERDAEGNMWMTVTGVDQIQKLDVKTGELKSWDHPQIGSDKGRYPHTHAFDAKGRLWYTLTISNHVAMFDPKTEQFTYYKLPGVESWTGPVPIPVAYGLDVAPDQTVWYSQLLGDTIGKVDPETGKVTAYKTPFMGPRRLWVGPDNVVWVPGYGDSKLGRFDPKTEQWKVYTLPTEPKGNDLPYALSVNRRTGDVWIAGSNSDTLIRFEPKSERFTVFPLNTPVDFTREIEFDDQNNVWTCAPDRGVGPEGPLSGRFIKLQLLPRVGSCGDKAIQLGEQCDDGNTKGGDGCSASCTFEDGARQKVASFED